MSDRSQKAEDELRNRVDPSRADLPSDVAGANGAPGGSNAASANGTNGGGAAAGAPGNGAGGQSTATNRWIGPVLVSLIGAFMSILDTSVVNVAIPTIMNVFNAGTAGARRGTTI